ncbi:VWA domain-containing protein [Pseudomonas sp. P8_250]|uniref:VWA domain-containing protein n=1 Tax=Pseudomonas sp. P8_250 TaxID=3043446 RepID=UPI002A36DA63|nr:VWA domain-containing protein [Pseudomonas sp. P8_250]MDX9668687.1 VWA domain-containing protein [Pseudomonas sp. P8_250]
MRKNDVVEIVAIVDQSGSMSSVRDDAIGGFNTFLADQQAQGDNARLTLVLFDDRYLVPVKDVPIQEVQPLDHETYVPKGMTAMNDAIGRVLVELEEKNPKKAIITILTDGAENASKEFNSVQIKSKIKAAEDRGWQVVFLAANIDAFAAGGSLGISGSNTFAFAANSQGVHEAFACMSVRASSYRSA